MKQKIVFITVVFLLLGVMGHNLAKDPKDYLTRELSVNDENQNISLTETQLEYVFDLGEKYLLENSTSTEEEVDTYMKNIIYTLSNENNSLDFVGSYYGGLTKEEFYLSVRHPFKALKVKKCVNKAYAKTTEFYVDDATYKKNGDAFRHVYWNALMTKEIGAEYAEKFATAHESESEDALDTLMDMKNNKIGRSLVKKYSKISDDEIANKARTEVRNGNCYQIVNEELISTNAEGER
ncbi:conserved hypothetical protein [Alteracholeplasma palmae J233]|uniref:DUF6973 domain-containing protein n=1 Tax=Alteracholeplasma palmae (strain ATCC 49389 / J233) TaxID=1318466 RepID=U4KPE5_ALTPJ|nr:hypothetical protein [Alteracholeplasma palmae]CCV64105.1 conserved hypothetical protein [Alteracholeplasma palmae J233]